MKNVLLHKYFIVHDLNLFIQVDYQGHTLWIILISNYYVIINAMTLIIWIIKVMPYG